MSTLQDFSIHSLQGDTDLIPQLSGKVVLAVNVASKCGLTPQYAGLQQLQDELAALDFVVVGFPCNQFGAQEPGTPEEITRFCSTSYGVSFPLTEKIDVNGAGQHPIYAWFQEHFPGAIEWNFEKFLIDRDGKVVKRYPPATTPADPVIAQDITDVIGQRS